MLGLDLLSYVYCHNSDDEINKLAARALRAEMMGQDKLAAEIRSKIDELKKKPDTRVVVVPGGKIDVRATSADSPLTITGGVAGMRDVARSKDGGQSQSVADMVAAEVVALCVSCGFKCGDFPPFHALVFQLWCSLSAENHAGTRVRSRICTLFWESVSFAGSGRGVRPFRLF